MEDSKKLKLTILAYGEGKLTLAHKLLIMETLGNGGEVEVVTEKDDFKRCEQSMVKKVN